MPADDLGYHDLIARRDRALAEAELLNGIAIAVAGEEDLTRMLKGALDRLASLIAFTGGSIALVEDDDLVIVAALGPFAAQALGMRLPHSGGRAWQIIDTAQPFFSNNLQADGVRATSQANGQTLHSFLGVPLVWRGTVYGLLEVDSTETNAFQPVDLPLLRAVAALLSGPIELARRLHSEVRARQQVEQLAAERDRALAAASAAQSRLALLAAANATLAGSLDLAATLEAVARLAVPALADWCIIDLCEPDGTLHRPLVYHADPERAGLAAELRDAYAPRPDGNNGIVKVIRTGQAELVPVIDAARLQRSAIDERHMAVMHGIGLASAVCVPLIARDRVMGALTCFLGHGGRQYCAEDLSLAEELARRAALAIDNARLHQQTQQALETRDQFLSIAAHELKTPVTALLSYTQLLQRRLQRAQALSDRDASTLHAIANQTIRLQRLIASLLDISRMQTGRMELEPQPLDVAALVRRTIEEVRPTLEAHTISLQHDSQPVVIHGDELRLEQVFQNLISNAVKYSPNGGGVEVAITPAPDHVVVQVRDHGIGIPAAQLPCLFSRFYRADNVNDYQITGMGLGLYIVREIIDLHGGQIQVSSVEGQGSTFSVQLPTLATTAPAAPSQPL